MSSPDRALRRGIQPVRMDRVALIAPSPRVREMLETVGTSGLVELEPAGTEPTRSAELDRRAREMVEHGPVAAVVGWTPTSALPALTDALSPLGAAAVPLARPRGVQPPTLLTPQRRGRSFGLLVETYATVPYADIDPTLVAGLAYVAMFGMMFGDAGHGVLLLIAGLVVRSNRFGKLARFRRGWPFLVGAGAASTVFGLLYGEAFGPTGLIPVLWLNPLDEPITLLLAALGVGALLLAGAFGLGTANRLREGGLRFALYARSGVPGTLLFLALGGSAAGGYLGIPWLLAIGVIIAVVGLTLAFIGLLVSAESGPTGVLQAIVELFDLVVRLGSNVVSFARLAAFGLTHAALGTVIWNGTTALWGSGLATIGAVAIFLVGNAIAFSLEALVGGIQALRLEYYELFSRVFDTEGRPFRPWVLPTEDTSEEVKP